MKCETCNAEPASMRADATGLIRPLCAECEPGFEAIVNAIPGGVSVSIDHPIAKYTWVIPEERALELIELMQQRLGQRTTAELKAALREACDRAEEGWQRAQADYDYPCRDRVAELRKLGEET